MTRLYSLVMRPGWEERIPNYHAPINNKHGVFLFRLSFSVILIDQRSERSQQMGHARLRRSQEGIRPELVSSSTTRVYSGLLGSKRMDYGGE